MKLITVYRKLGIYRIGNNKPVAEIPVELSLTKLKKIVKPQPADDHQLYLPYELNSKQVEKLVNLIDFPFNLDFELFFYVLECEGIYGK